MDLAERDFGEFEKLLVVKNRSPKDLVNYARFMHSFTVKKVWDVGDEYTVCAECGHQTGWPGNEYGLSKCDTLKLLEDRS